MDELDVIAANLRPPKERFQLAPRLIKKPDPIELPTTKVASTVSGARSDKELIQFLAEHGAEKVFVTFGSTWCHSCHAVFPHLYRLTSKFPQFKYVIAQIDYMQDAAEGVEFTPTFRMVQKGKTVDQFYGADQQMLQDRLWLHSD